MGQASGSDDTITEATPPSPTIREKARRAQVANQTAFRQLGHVRRLLDRLIEAPNEAVAYDAAQQLAELGLEESLSHTLQLTNEAIDEASAQFKRYLVEYGTRFRSACEQLGYVVEGRYPEFWVNHTVRVKVDGEARRARVQRKELRADVSVEAVVTALQQEIERLTGGPFDPQAFLGQLWDAYRALTADKHHPLDQGRYVSVLEVYQWLKQRMDRGTVEGKQGRVDYPLDRFAADLSRVLQHGTLRTSDGWVLALEPARGKGKVVFLFDPRVARARYLGLLAFRKE